MITENLSTLKIYKLTQEQYEQRVASGELEENALYLTPDEEIDLNPYATVEQVNAKADAEHNHEINDVTNLQSSLDELLENAKSHTNEVVATKADSVHNHDSSYDAKGSADAAFEASKQYTDNAMAKNSQVQFITWEAND